jgi:5-bromo-4-chloroindolyl phosphate hydrolysis protein
MPESNDSPNRVDRLENGMIDIKMAVSALLSTVEIHQRDMDVFRANADRTNQNIEAMVQIMTQSLQRMEVMESDIRGLQTENHRILDILQQRNMNDG